MRRIILFKAQLIIAFIFISCYSNAQSFPLKQIPWHTDKEIIKYLCDSLRKYNVDTFFTFLTVKDENNYAYLIWTENRKTKILRVSDSSVSQARDIKTTIFQNKELKDLSIKEKENQLLFKPPLFASKDCDILLFEGKKTNYLIECGECGSFALDAAKTKGRCDLLNSIKADINALGNDWQVFMKYNR